MITVTRSTNWKGQPGYRWVCTDHPRNTGFHHFDRFTDRIRRTPDTHPWVRAMSAAVCHFHLFHRQQRKKAS